MSGPDRPRLSSAMLVSALMRRVQAAGGFATVLHRGDEQAGAVLVECTDRGQRQILLERATNFDGSDHWRDTGGRLDNAGGSHDIADPAHAAMIERRRKTDPDLWVIELDIANAERFTVDMFD